MSRLPIQALAILAFALTLFFIWDFSQRIVTNIHLAQTEQDLEGKVAQAEATRGALIALKTRIASPDYAEQIARSKWRWARDGETLVVTQVTPVAPTPVPNAPASTPQPQGSWWQQLFDFLFGP